MAIIGTLRKVGANRIQPPMARQGNVMILLLLEALGALLLLVFIVWWTMFSGREKGELKDDAEKPTAKPEKGGE